MELVSAAVYVNFNVAVLEAYVHSEFGKYTTVTASGSSQPKNCAREVLKSPAAGTAGKRPAKRPVRVASYAART